MGLEEIVTFLHNIAIATWVGGLITLFFVKGVIKKFDSDSNILITNIYKRFSTLAVLSIAVLVVTGIALTFFHGGTARVQLDIMLNIKHILVFLVIVNGAFLRMKILPSLDNTAPKKGGTPSAKNQLWMRRLEVFSNINLVLAILIVLFAVL